MIFEKCEIRPFCSNDMRGFKEMFCTYFRDDMMMEITDDEAESICNEIADSISCGIVSLDLLLVDEKLAGFIIYQIDHPDSDWCEREGWGFIREVYINSCVRGNGFGSKLAAHAEKVLYDKGVEHIYLSSDVAGEFWSLHGYKETGEVSKINHCPVYEK